MFFDFVDWFMGRLGLLSDVELQLECQYGFFGGWLFGYGFVYGNGFGYW